MFTSNDDFNVLNELLGSNNDLFQQDVTTLRGKNVVLDFIAQIDFEIRLFGWSKTASKIAEFHDTCGGYCIFMYNPVVKMILNETEYNSTVKKYLYQRIFQYIEQDKIQDISSNAILDSILNWVLTPSDIGQQKSIKKNKTKE